MALVWGFGILFKDTLTCGQEEPGIKPPILGILDDYLSYSCHLGQIFLPYFSSKQHFFLWNYCTKLLHKNETQSQLLEAVIYLFYLMTIHQKTGNDYVGLIVEGCLLSCYMV